MSYINSKFSEFINKTGNYIFVEKSVSGKWEVYTRNSSGNGNGSLFGSFDTKEDAYKLAQKQSSKFGYRIIVLPA